MPTTSTQDWFYNVPSKKSDAPAKDTPAPSQIPGLSNIPDDQVMEDDRTARRKWIRDTDSKYVKLAKAGGRRDLLKYRDPPAVSTEAIPYPRVDWFDHPNSADDDNELNKTARDCRVLPDWYVHDVDQHVDDPETVKRVSSKIAGLPSKRGPEEKNRKQILSFDTLSYWEREKMNDMGKDKKLPNIKRSKAKLSNSQSQVNTLQNGSQTKINKNVKLPQISKEPVVFSELMSMAYQRQWLEDQRKEREKSRAQKKETQAEKRSKFELSSQPQRKFKVKEHEEEKPLFKMSKFANVPARVQLV